MGRTCLPVVLTSPSLTSRACSAQRTRHPDDGRVRTLKLLLSASALPDQTRWVGLTLLAAIYGDADGAGGVGAAGGRGLRAAGDARDGIAEAAIKASFRAKSRETSPVPSSSGGVRFAAAGSPQGDANNSSSSDYLQA